MTMLNNPLAALLLADQIAEQRQMVAWELESITDRAEVFLPELLHRVGQIKGPRARSDSPIWCELDAEPWSTGCPSQLTVSARQRCCLSPSQHTHALLPGCIRIWYPRQCSHL